MVQQPLPRLGMAAPHGRQVLVDSPQAAAAGAVAPLAPLAGPLKRGRGGGSGEASGGYGEAFGAAATEGLPAPGKRWRPFVAC
mmetsp:Transcript_18851/g.49001  ORF Transcript_18851/g.49001 Transcript_18851/m.49001 type:complete len:83 (-) Transcript_18851:1402-1650(-)